MSKQSKRKEKAVEILSELYQSIIQEHYDITDMDREDYKKVCGVVRDRVCAFLHVYHGIEYYQSTRYYFPLKKEFFHVKSLVEGGNIDYGFIRGCIKENPGLIRNICSRQRGKPQRGYIVFDRRKKAFLNVRTSQSGEIAVRISKQSKATFFDEFMDRDTTLKAIKSILYKGFEDQADLSLVSVKTGSEWVASFSEMVPGIE